MEKGKKIQKALKKWKEKKEKALKVKFKLEKEIQAWKFLKGLTFPKGKEKEKALKELKSFSFKEKEKQLKKALKNPWKVISSYSYNLYNSRPWKTNLLYKRLEKEILFTKGLEKKEKLERIERLESERKEKLERKSFFKNSQKEKNFLLNNISSQGKGKKFKALISRLEYQKRKKEKLFQKIRN